MKRLINTVLILIFLALLAPASADTPVQANQGSPGTRGAWPVKGAGTAGTADTGVVTIQGIASGTNVPISGTVTVTDAANGTVGSTVPTTAKTAGFSDGTNLRVPRVIDLDTGVGTIYGTIASLQASGSGSTTEVPVAQGSTTSGQFGFLSQAAVTTSAPSYTNAQTSPLNVTTAGGLRTDLTTINNGVTVLAGNGVTGTGSLRVTVASDNTAFNVTSNSANIATEASLAKLTLGQASTTSGQTGPLAQGAVTTGDPTYTNAQTDPLSLATTGRLRVDSAGSVAHDSVDAGNPVKIGFNAQSGDPTAVAASDRANATSNLFGEIRTAVPNCAGTAVSISSGTTTATGTTVAGTLYLISCRGVGVHAIWAASATLATGFWLAEGAMIYQRGSGTSFSVITVAGSGVCQLVPCSF